MKLKLIFFLLFVHLIHIEILAQITPTWSADIANIIYNNCSSCHRNGGLAPFPLMSYNDAVLHAPDILQSVTNKLMPPWKPDANYRHFKGERNLKSSEISKIQDWINGNTPFGNLATAPQPPVFNIGSQMQNIDKTIATLNYTVQGNADVYRTFVVHSNNTTSKYINEIEFVPGNNQVVHHIILFQDSTNYSNNLDLADPAPGFASNGTMQQSPAANYVCVWAPGAGNYLLPSNMGIKVPAGADYLIEVHYAPGSNGLSDSSTINIKYTNSPTIREVEIAPFMDWGPGSMINPTSFIPANQVKTYKQKFANTYTDFSVLSIFPHMHKVAQSYKIFSTNAANLDTTPYIYIPAWDFHWQGFYTFQKIQKLSLNENLWGIGVYDNTSNNPENPNNPPANVYWGEQTTDEMMITFLAYTLYQPGDENIVLDSLIFAGSNKQELYRSNSIYPNPCNESIYINNSSNQSFNYEIINSTGMTLLQGVQKDSKIDLQKISSGIYTLKTNINGKLLISRFIKN